METGGKQALEKLASDIRKTKKTTKEGRARQTNKLAALWTEKMEDNAFRDKFQEVLKEVR